MSTATQTVQDNITVATASLDSPIMQDANEREVRWGIQVSQRDKPVNSYETGFSHVPFGQFFAINSLNVKRENHTIDWTQPKEKEELLTAATREKFLMELLGGHGAQGQVDWGLKTAFLGERDVSKMAVISATLLPPLSSIRDVSEQFGAQTISAVCEGSDDLDFGVRETCISCWWKWIQSPVLDAYIESVALTGRNVTERDPAGNITERLVKPAIADLKAAKAAVIDAMRQGIKELEKQWTQIAAEYEKNDQVRKDISDFEHGYRKDLHQNKPQDRQFALAREIAKGTAANASGGNDDLMRLMVESQLETNKLLREVVKDKPLAVETDPAITQAPPATAPATETVPATELAPGAQKMQEAKKKQ